MTKGEELLLFTAPEQDEETWASTLSQDFSMWLSGSPASLVSSQHMVTGAPGGGRTQSVTIESQGSDILSSKSVTSCIIFSDLSSEAMQHLPADFCLQTNPKHRSAVWEEIRLPVLMRSKVLETSFHCFASKSVGKSHTNCFIKDYTTV